MTTLLTIGGEMVRCAMRQHQELPLLRITSRSHHAHNVTLTDRSTTLRLYQDFLAGSDDAFLEIYRLHHQQLYLYAVKMLYGDEQAGRDIVQTTWEKVIGFRSVASPPAVDNLKAFLLRMVRNACLDHHKHQKYQEPLPAEELFHPATPDSDLSTEEELVIQALGELVPETREMLVLHYYLGYSFEEIAELTGKNAGAVWTRMSRARTQLKEILQVKLEQERKGMSATERSKRRLS